VHGFRSVLAAVGLVLAASAGATGAVAPHDAMRARWRQPQAPIRIHGNTWYLRSRGLAAILITSPRGHVLIDGTLAETAPLSVANIRAPGFRLRDVRLILNSQAHGDHAGAIASVISVARRTCLPPCPATS